MLRPVSRAAPLSVPVAQGVAVCAVARLPPMPGPIAGCCAVLGLTPEDESGAEEIPAAPVPEVVPGTPGAPVAPSCEGVPAGPPEVVAPEVLALGLPVVVPAVPMPVPVVAPG